MKTRSGPRHGTARTARGFHHRRGEGNPPFPEARGSQQEYPAAPGNGPPINEAPSHQMRRWNAPVIRRHASCVSAERPSPFAGRLSERRRASVGPLPLIECLSLKGACGCARSFLHPAGTGGNMRHKLYIKSLFRKKSPAFLVKKVPRLSPDEIRASGAFFPPPFLMTAPPSHDGFDTRCGVRFRPTIPHEGPTRATRDGSLTAFSAVRPWRCLCQLKTTMSTRECLRNHPSSPLLPPGPTRRPRPRLRNFRLFTRKAAGR